LTIGFWMKLLGAQQKSGDEVGSYACHGGHALLNFICQLHWAEGCSDNW
jgi:hypothetical protein